MSSGIDSKTSRGIWTWIFIIGAIFVFYKTDPETSWKKQILSLLGDALSDKIVSAQETLEPGSMKMWEWHSKKGNSQPTITVKFKDNSPKSLNVFVVNTDQLSKVHGGDQFSYFKCLSRLSVSNYECTAKVDTGGNGLAFVVQNSVDSLGDVLSSQSASFELQVSAME